MSLSIVTHIYTYIYVLQVVLYERSVCVCVCVSVVSEEEGQGKDWAVTPVLLFSSDEKPNQVFTHEYE